MTPTSFQNSVREDVRTRVHMTTLTPDISKRVLNVRKIAKSRKPKSGGLNFSS